MITWTIVTPTLQRKSLIDACESVNAQEVPWQHLIMVDSAELNRPILDAIAHPQRTIIQCSKPHKNSGNSCRHNAYLFVAGELVFYLDDDNVLADHRVLADIGFAMESAQMPAWGVFPITRLGSTFYSDPPRSCHTDTMNMVFRRDHALWPDTDAYGADGVMLEALMAAEVPYAAFPDFRPIGVLPKISFGKEDE